MQNSTPRRSRHVGTWILVIIALGEGAALAVLLTFRLPLCAAMPRAQTAGAIQIQPGGGGAGGNGNDAGSGSAAVPPLAAPSAASAPAASPADASAANGDASAQGDLNQVPDPNCVAKAAAGVLNTDTAPPTTPSCAPMSPPPALKSAEQQVQSSP